LCCSRGGRFARAGHQGKNASAEALAAFDAKYGYDKPLFCGHWARLRALEDRKRDCGAGNAERGVRSAEYRVPLAYALPAGTYRLSLGGLTGDDHPSVSVAIQPIDAARLSPTVSLACAAAATWQVVFTVPEESRAAAIVVTGAVPASARLRQRTGHFFDSQLCHFLYGLVRGELGSSAEYDTSVAQVLRSGIWPSLAITVPILAGGTILAVMLGLFCAMWRGGGVDRSILLVSTLLMSVNYVVWVLAGQYFLPSGCTSSRSGGSRTGPTSCCRC